MKFYSLQEAVDMLISTDHTISVSKLIRESIAGAVILAIPLNIDSRYSPTHSARLEEALDWLINKIEEGVSEEDLAFQSKDSIIFLGFKAITDCVFGKKIPDVTVRFNSEQSKFLMRLRDDVLSRCNFSNMSARNKIRELRDIDGKAYKLIEKMSNVRLCGLYRVMRVNLLDFDVKGESHIECVASLDGKDLYFPFVDATSNMLRITADELGRYKATLTPSARLTTEPIPGTTQKQAEPKKKNELNEEWQKSLENMAADLIKSGKKSLATKESLAGKLAQEIGENAATIERNTRKTW